MIKNVKMMSLLVLIVFTLFPILQVAHVASAENHPPADGHVHPPPPRTWTSVAGDISKLLGGSAATCVGACVVVAGFGISTPIVTAPVGAGAAALGAGAALGGAAIAHSSGRNLWNDITGLFDGDDD